MSKTYENRIDFEQNGTTIATDHHEQCAICVDKSDIILKARSYGHTIGRTCLEKWLDTGANNCPFCRHEWFVDEAQQDRVLFREALDSPANELLDRLSDIALRGNVPEADEMLRVMIRSMLEHVNSLFGVWAGLQADCRRLVVIRGICGNEDYIVGI